MTDYFPALFQLKIVCFIKKTLINLFPYKECVKQYSVR